MINDSIIPPPSTSVKLSAGSYVATIKNEYGCFYEEEIIVEDGPPLQINTIDDLTISLGHSVIFETTSNLNIWMSLWTPPDGLACPQCFSTLATPLEDKTYIITAKTEEGCIDMDSIKVRVDPTPNLFIPNVFSPNNDHINDHFTISADPASIRSIDKVLIFDRWGGIISQESDLFNEGQIVLWDGFTANGPVNPGVYVYMISFTLADGSERTVSGDVTVLK